MRRFGWEVLYFLCCVWTSSLIIPDLVLNVVAAAFGVTCRQGIVWLLRRKA
jgi:hypothetical protein